MSARILQFPRPHDHRHGTVCVMGDIVRGFQVAHESASGNSWGNFCGPYRTGQEAITGACSVNRNEYQGLCNVSICDAAWQHAHPDVEPPSNPGDF